MGYTNESSQVVYMLHLLIHLGVTERWPLQPKLIDAPCTLKCANSVGICSVLQFSRTRLQQGRHETKHDSVEGVREGGWFPLSIISRPKPNRSRGATTNWLDWLHAPLAREGTQNLTNIWPRIESEMALCVFNYNTYRVSHQHLDLGLLWLPNSCWTGGNLAGWA